MPFGSPSHTPGGRLWTLKDDAPWISSVSSTVDGPFMRITIQSILASYLRMAGSNHQSHDSAHGPPPVGLSFQTLSLPPPCPSHAAMAVWLAIQAALFQPCLVCVHTDKSGCKRWPCGAPIQMHSATHAPKRTFTHTHKHTRLQTD